jgi:predicted DNA-binding protein
MRKEKMEELITIRLPLTLLKKLDERAEKLKVKRSKLIREIIKAYIEGEEKVIIKKVVPRVSDQSLFKNIKSWDDQLKILAQLASQAYANAQAYIEVGETGKAIKYFDLTHKFLKQALKAMKERDLDWIRKNISKLKEIYGKEM